MEVTMTEQEEFVELVRIDDLIEADLLTTFLEDSDVEYRVANRSGAGLMSGLMPASENPVIFLVLNTDLEMGQQLLEEFRSFEKADIPADDAVVTEDDDASSAESDEKEI
jgi:hypothetical protein